MVCLLGSDELCVYDQIYLFAVLCSGFDLTVLDPSDRKGNNMYVSLLLRIKRWDLYLRNR